MIIRDRIFVSISEYFYLLLNGEYYMSDKINENITLQRIKELKGGDSQEVFAQRIHSTQSNVSKMLKGTPPSASTLRTLAEEYQVSVDWLLGLSDKKELGNVAKTQIINGELLTYADVIVVLDALYKKIQSMSV